MRVNKRWRIVAAALLLAGLASSQGVRVPVQIDDNGAVIAAHQHRHVRNGNAVAWGRANAGASWFVRFVQSPCAGGVKEFGSAAGQPRTCVIAVCMSNDASCKSYPYNSALGPDQGQHDPDVIVDN
jgi:hypothetical protein